MSWLETTLSDRYTAESEAVVDAFIGIQVGSQSCVMQATDGGIVFCHEAPDFTLIFEDQTTFENVLGDMQAAIQAFMQGKFRSTGYIMWSFQTLRMFNSD